MNESKNQPAEKDEPKNKEVEGHASNTSSQPPISAPGTEETTVPRDDV